ncbi:N-acetylmuramoyl-L-alanine amidase [Cellulosimicrobium aquatile]|uniref:peptidoglycan recognition protein family protein n=1 Tax=Cellulosimicrobium aquatile TaxID=1612203 RepID=UPI001459D928|nr:N-acetylmuramoyl-L-alanine amidase [Cellulosimicrobium aquatile]
MRGHDVVCLHTMAGSFAGTKAMFLRDGYGGTESHYGVAGSGYAEQWQDRAHTADANLDGRWRVISIETADMGETFPPGAWSDPPWTPAQFETLARIVAWECSPAAHADCPPSWTCHRVGIPLQLMTNSSQRGVGYHRLGVDGAFPTTGLEAGRLQRGGGERWSDQRGKACPGRNRIHRMPALVERARQITTGQGGFLMALTDQQQQDIYDALFGRSGTDRMNRLMPHGQNLAISLSVLRGDLAPVERTDPNTGKVIKIPLRQEIANANTALAAQAGQIAGLTTALGQVAGGDVDLAAIREASRQGVADALAAVEATVTVKKG